MNLLKPATLFVAAALLASCAKETAVSTSEPVTATGTTTTTTAEITGPITVYSGRNEKLIGPLIDRFQKERGIEVNVRYGDTAEMAATLLEEGTRTPADVFISQDAAALGAVTGANMARPLPADVVTLVPATFRGPEAKWVGISGRARSLVFNSQRMKPEALPQSLKQLTEPRFKGKFGLAPTNASFQAHMAVYNVLHGEAALETLLKGIVENHPKRYSNNAMIVQAAGAGEIDFGLVNHYYTLQAKKRKADLPVANHFLSENDGSGFVNVAGVAVLSDKPAATEFTRFLLSEEAQRYFASETFEYPLVPSVQTSAELPAIDSLKTPAVDYAQVSKVLPRTLELINSSGLTRQ